MREDTPAAVKEKKAKPRYGRVSNCLWMAGIAGKCCRIVLWFTAGQVVCGAARALLELFVAPAILRQASGGSFGAMLGTVGAFCGGLMLTGAARNYMDQNEVWGRLGVRVEIINRLLRKYCTTSYVHLEQPGFLAAADSAFECATNASKAAQAIWTTLVNLFTHLITFTLWTTLLVRISPLLIVVTVLFSFINYLAVDRVGKWRYAHQKEEDRCVHRAVYLDKKMKDGRLAKDIRIFGLEGWLRELHAGAMRLMEDFYRKAENKFFCADALGVFLSLARNSLAYVYLLRQAAAGALDASGFLLYFTAVTELANWVNSLFGDLTTLGVQSRELSHLREWLDTPEPYRTEGGAQIPVPADGAYTIELKDVRYRYPGAARDTLSHLNLTLRAGEHLAVVGLNGAGKTTLVKLLCGFLDPTEGAVLLNGQDIRRFDRRAYYALFGAVFQKVSVLAASIAENVAMVPVEGDVPIDRARVRECLAGAGLLDAVDAMPKGLDTLLNREVYVDGQQLSGGQEQRLVLARALYKDAPVVVLDEPTAALDPLAESDLYHRFGELTAGRSAVYISHRLASTRFCDRIVLLEDGRIAACGTHSELLAAGGRYAELFEIQSRYYRTSPNACAENEKEAYGHA